MEGGKAEALLHVPGKDSAADKGIDAYVESIAAGAARISPIVASAVMTVLTVTPMLVPTVSGYDETTLGGRLIGKRRRYGVRNRIYEAHPEEIVEIAEAADVPLEEVKEVTKGPERNRKGDGSPKHEDESGNLFWYPHEVWGRGSKGWEEKFTSPLGEDFFRTIELLKLAENRPKTPQQAVWQQNQQTLLLLLLT